MKNTCPMKNTCMVVRAAMVVLCLLPAIPNIAAAADPAAPLLLARDGRTRYAIVIARDAGPAETLAAEELALFLKQMTGAVFPVRTDDAPITDTEIVLGDTTRKARSDLPSHLRTDNWEGFAIVREDERLLIMGNIPRATLYGVYDFLDVELGVRFLAHMVNYVPTRPTLEVAATSRVYGPPIERRTIWEGGLLGDATRRNRMNGISFQVMDEKTLGGVKMIGRPTHSFQAFVPHENYFKDHPEYFAFYEGERRDRYKGIITQPCMTNPDVQRLAMDMVLAWLDEAHQQNPYNKYVVSVSANDSPWHCQCEPCLAINLEEGVVRGAGGPQVRLLNAIAARVAVKYPQALLKTMFYQSDPPQKTRPASNVILEVVSSIDWRYPFDDPSKPGVSIMADRFANGSRMVGDGSLYVWTKHTILFSDYFKPNPNLRYIAYNIRIMNEKYRARGFFAQNVQSAGADLQPLRYYLLARAMWRPQDDSRPQIEEFCRHYYGPAADDVLRYLAYLHEDYGEKAVSRGDEHRVFTRTDEQRHIRIAEDMLAEAESKADTIAVRLRVATLRMTGWKMMLDHAYADMRNDPSYVAPPEVRMAGRRFIETGRAARVTHMSESYRGRNVQTEREYYRRIRKLLRHGRPDDPSDPWIEDDDGLLAADLTNAKRLNLCGSSITDAGLAALRHATQLESLDIRYTDVTDEGLVHLEGLENLTELHLGGDARNVGTKITDLGISSLRRMKKLTVLTLVHTRVGNQSMTILRDMTGLKHLALSYTQVKDQGLADVATLKALQHLDLYTTAVTDAGIGHLQQLDKLDMLNLYDVTSVTEEAVNTLQRANPDLHVRRY